jgi:ubiquinol-cytochrome c reductase subunit 9
MKFITVHHLVPVPARGCGKMAAIAGRLYNPLFRKTSTFAATIMLGAFFFERAFDVTSEYIFDSINHGVRFLWWYYVSCDSKRYFI